MTLIDNASQILRKAWSVKMALLTTLFATLEVLLPAIAPTIPPGTMASIASESIVLSVAVAGVVIVWLWVWDNKL